MTTRTASRPIGASVTDTELNMPIIDMAVPMPGFPAHRQFVLVRLNDNGLLYAFTSVDDPNLRFLVAPPEPFFPDYAPEIDDEALASLGANDTDNLLVLLVVSAGATAVDSTANLMAPIVVNEANRRAIQLVLSGSGLSVRQPLMGG